MSEAPTHKHSFQTEAVYRYNEGRMRKVKRRCACGAKSFSWSTRLGSVWTQGQSEKPGLYGRCPDPQPGGGTLWVVEGEADVEALYEFGEWAVSPPNGAGSWTDDFTEAVRSWCPDDIFVVYDGDSAGRKHAAQVRKSLGRGTLVKVPGAKDVREYLSLSPDNRPGDLLPLNPGSGPDDEPHRRSILDGAPHPYYVETAALRPDDPVMYGGYQGPEWPAYPIPDPPPPPVRIARQGHTVPADLVAVVCEKCRNYLAPAARGKAYRACWWCREELTYTDVVDKVTTRVVPLKYRIEK